MARDIVGQMLGHYRITEQIERGGMATVYRATDIHLQREVAIKIFQITDDERTTKSFSQRFLREAQVVASLDHPNILLVHDYGEEHGLAYLVMPYLAQGSLKQILQKRRVLPILEALDLFMPVLDALQYSHDHSLIHRDIKPGNILFKSERTLVLADFGLVKEFLANDEVWPEGGTARKQSSLSNGLLIGTPQYMAPEQVQGNAVPISDIYSMGLVLYEMLTGTHPFLIDSDAELLGMLIRQLYHQPPSPRTINPAIPPQLEAAIMRALEKDVHKRYQHPRDFLQTLQECRTQLSSSMPPTLYTRQPTSEASSNLSYSTLTKEDQIPTISLPSTVPLATSGYSSPISTPPTMQGILQPVQRPERHIALKTALAALIVMLVLGSLWIVKPGPLVDILQQTRPNARTTPLSPMTATSLPPMKTDCPAVGKARAAVTSSLASQGHNNVVYIGNDSALDGSSGKVMTYDVVTGKTRTITTLPRPIVNAQLFNSGQWILLVSQRPEPSTERTWLQIVRLDGQGLQTLYCSAPAVSIHEVLLSPDNDINKTHLIFNERVTPAKTTLSMLTLNNGVLTQELSPQNTYSPITWISNNNNVLLENQQGDLYHLNIKEEPQMQDTFPSLVTTGSGKVCHDFSASSDNNVVYSSYCQGMINADNVGSQPTSGPSIINAIDIDENGNFSTPHPIFTSDTLALTQIRAITSTTLLLHIENADAYNGEDGLWKLNTMTKQAQRLVSETKDTLFLNTFSRSPWANTSLDGTFYAIKTGSKQSVGFDKLLIGSLNGDQPKVIDQSGSHGMQLAVVGWTM